MYRVRGPSLASAPAGGPSLSLDDYHRSLLGSKRTRPSVRDGDQPVQGKHYYDADLVNGTVGLPLLDCTCRD